RKASRPRAATPRGAALLHLRRGVEERGRQRCDRAREIDVRARDLDGSRELAIARVCIDDAAREREEVIRVDRDVPAVAGDCGCLDPAAVLEDQELGIDRYVAAGGGPDRG